MNDLSNRSALVVDTGGANVATALRLAEDFGHVYYCTNFHRGFDQLPEAAPGMGFDEIEWVWDEFSVEPDLYVFPDCSHVDLQNHLINSGKRVWGSVEGSWLELKRKLFLEAVSNLGLPVPKYQPVRGISNLTLYLQEHPDVFVKCSYWRGSCETHHHITMEMSESWLVHLAKEFGGLKEKILFIVIEPIDAFSEMGYDGYCVLGKFPDLSMMGIETKDKSYIGTVTKYEDLPEPVRAVNEAFSAYLKQVGYRNRWSTEIRVTSDHVFYFLDPTCRIPSPAGEAQLANEENTGQIYWEGASGNLVEPQYKKKFSVQVVINHEDEMCEWRPVDVPQPIASKVFLKYPCKVYDLYWIPPQKHDDIIGWIVGLGDTIEDAITDVEKTAEVLDGQNLKINVDSLADSLKAVQEQEKHGIEFTDQPVPEPESVVEKE